ncbi:PKD-like domain-containing protein, partial [Flavobacterium sp. MAHUQ-51]|uniref:PKD-like domain-containing protein n=1 Tax=Flavobacterium sp. GCM10022190 TaxID=3252639 RepID=UPI00360C9302
MKTTLPNRELKHFFRFVLILLSSFTLHAQSKYDCNNCESGDERILSVELVSTTPNPNPTSANDLYLPLSQSCDSGENVQGYLKINIQQQSTTRYGFLVEADIFTNNSKTGSISYCNSASTSSGTRSVYITNQAISWSCGTVISLQKIIIGWGNSSGQNVCSQGNCSIGPQCSNNELNPVITVITPLSANFTTSSICPGNTSYKDITFTSTSTGGTPPYQYQWVINNGVNTITTPYSSTNSYTYTPSNGNNLNVTLNIKDSSTNQKTDNFTQSGITVGTCCTTPVIANKTATICSGGTFTITPTNNNPDVVPANTTYSWSAPTNALGISGNAAGTNQSNISGTLTNTNAFPLNVIYNVTPKSGTCTGNPFTVTVTVNPTLSLATSTKTDASCYGTSTGSVTAGSITGSVGTVTYSWKNAANMEVGTTATVNNLPAGTYTLTVTDNCSSQSNSVTIGQPNAALTASIAAQTNVDCYGNNSGSVTVAGANGTAPYTYAIDGTTFGTSGTFASLAAGSYTVTIKDDNGCTTTQAVTITQPNAALTASIAAQTNVDCYGNNSGSVTVAG